VLRGFLEWIFGQQWIIRFAGGKRLRTAAIAESLGCSQATAKRELDFLRSTGAIEFIGPSKTGGYQLRLVMSE
jgi:predicted DNA-binding transcriptional regulator YafY